MSEELSLALAYPVVKLLKVNPFNDKKIEVRAATPQNGLSLHYTVREGIAPTANEKLLVAVLAGVYPSWLAPTDREALEEAARDEPVRITYTGESIATGECVSIDQISGDLTRLCISMHDKSGHAHHGAVVLTKEQVTSLLAALLAIYPRLQEA